MGARGFRRTRSWPRPGPMCARCGLPMGLTKSTWNRLPNMNWESGRTHRNDLLQNNLQSFFVFEGGGTNATARTPFIGRVKRIGGARNQLQRVVYDHARADSAIRRGHGRPAVDSPRSRACSARIAIRNNDCPWFSDAFAYQ